MKWQDFIKDYLTFNRKERVAILVILFLILIAVLLPGIVNTIQPPKIAEIDSSWANTINTLANNGHENLTGDENADNDKDGQYQFDPPITATNKLKPVLFQFDPNILSRDGWEKLGLKEKNIRTILNYRNKGGKFFKAEDLGKIYGLDNEDYERLLPFIRINGSNIKKDSASPTFTSSSQSSKVTPQHFRQYSIININEADTTAFIALPGIGAKLATRIINFREKLGGFYSVEQVGETFGLPDSTFQKIKQYLEIKDLDLRKLNINTATVEELKSHPYLKWSIANPLVAYRNEHGPFTSIEEIKNIPSLTSDIFNKIAPYLTCK